MPNRDALTRRKLKYFLRLNYPLQVVVDEGQVRGCYPDLPGCEVVGDSLLELEEIKATLEKVRREWLTERVEAGDTPPMPNSHLEA